MISSIIYMGLGVFCVLLIAVVYLLKKMKEFRKFSDESRDKTAESGNMSSEEASHRVATDKKSDNPEDVHQKCHQT